MIMGLKMVQNLCWCKLKKLVRHMAESIINLENTHKKFLFQVCNSLQKIIDYENIAMKEYMQTCIDKIKYIRFLVRRDIYIIY